MDSGRVPTDRQVAQKTAEPQLKVGIWSGIWSGIKGGIQGGIQGVKWLVGAGKDAEPRVGVPPFPPNTSISNREVDDVTGLKEVELEEDGLEGAELEQDEALQGELTAEQQRSKEQFRKMLLDKIHQDSPLYKALEKDKNRILDMAFRFNDQRVKENERLHSRSIVDAPSFDDGVVKANQRQLKLIFNVLEEAGLDKTKLQFFKQNPQLLLTELAIDQDLKSMIKELSTKNLTFETAFEGFKKAGENYYQEKLQGTLLFDDEYKSSAITYDICVSLQEAINELDLEDEEEVEALKKEFDKFFKEKYDQAEYDCGQKEFLAMRELAEEILRSDSEYQRAKDIVARKVQSEGERFDLVKAYTSDLEFRAAYHLIDDQYKAVGKLLGAENACRNKENINQLQLDAALEPFEEAAQYVKDHPGRMILSPVLVLSMAVGGVTVLPTAGAVMFAVQVTKQVTPVVLKSMRTAGIFHDIREAQYDKARMQPHLEKIFLEAPTEQQKRDKLESLLKKGLLFKEDIENHGLDLEFIESLTLDEAFLEANPHVKSYCGINGKLKIDKLPSLKEFEKARKAQLKTLNQTFAHKDSLKERIIWKECFANLHAQNMLYKADVDKLSSANRDLVLKELGLNYEDLPNHRDEVAFRNGAIFVLRGGQQLTEDERLDQIKQLHAKGLLFTEVLEKLNGTETPEELARIKIENKKLYNKIMTNRELYRRVQVEIDITKLQSAEVYYRREEHTLRRQHDEIRAPRLSVLKSTSSSAEDKLLALKLLYMDGLCFKQDLEWVDDQTKEDFAAFISKTTEARKAEHLEDAIATQALIMRYTNKIKAAVKEKPINETIVMDSLMTLHAEGLLSKELLAELARIIPGPTKIRFDKDYLVHGLTMVTGATLESLPDQATYYQTGLAARFLKLATVTKDVVVQGGMAVWNNPVNIVHGPLKGMKNVVEISIAALGETVTAFTDVDTRSLQDRAIRQLPEDQTVKRASTFLFNKGAGTLSWAAMGAAIGAWMGSTFGLTIVGAKAGGAVGGVYGTYVTEGKVTQIPKGGFIRAIKFSGIGGLMAGICVPTVVGVLTTGLFLAGIISLNAVLAVSTFGLSLIVPLIIFGVYAGYQYACLTGKDVEAEAPDIVLEGFSKYEAPNLEVAEIFVA